MIIKLLQHWSKVINSIYIHTPHSIQLDFQLILKMPPLRKINETLLGSVSFQNTHENCSRKTSSNFVADAAMYPIHYLGYICKQSLGRQNHILNGGSNLN